MSKLTVIMSFAMAAIMSFFSPLSVSHGQGSCCAECVMKKEDEIELVYEDEENQNKDE
tara:strand:+ start:738 stop:911 length:174 start_codon:yes stop_codon:yes gene_type:complete